MSDFLTGLIRRQQKPTDLVRPRLPSLFEDAPRVMAPEVHAQEETVRVEVARPESGRDDTDAAPMQNTRANNAVTTAAQIAVPAPPASDGPDPSSSQIQIIHRVEQRETAPFARAPHSDGPMTAFPKPSESPAPLPPGPSESPPPFFNVEPAHTQQSPPNSEVPKKARPVIEVLVEAESATTIRPRDRAPEPAAPVFPRPGPPPFALPRSQDARREPSTQQIPQSRPIDAEPVIHVTIGRIEVRAVGEQPEKPRRREASSPVMTLDDYLKSRYKR